MGKGGDFEREISKAFTKWLTGVEKPYKFWRMPGSGGLATIHEENTNLSGDIRSVSVLSVKQDIPRQISGNISNISKHLI
jgi:hypothetical protein